MTALEIYDLVTAGGSADFARLIRVCEVIGGYCLIRGLAVDCYVEPVYALDVEVVVTRLPQSSPALESDLRIQFTTDPRCQDFISRAMVQTVLGIPVRVAALEDVTQGKLWAWADPSRRLSKRKKDELDLIRLAEAWPELKRLYPPELAAMLDG